MCDPHKAHPDTHAGQSHRWWHDFPRPGGLTYGARMLRPIRLLATVLVLALGITLASVVGEQREGGGSTASAALYKDAYVIRFASHNIKCQRCGGDWRRRAHQTATKIQNTKSRVVALQEVGPDQRRILQNRLPGYRFWPRGKFGGKDSMLQIAWKRNLYRLMETGKIRVPVRGYWRVVPWVRLRVRNKWPDGSRNPAGGRQFYVIDIHNAPRNREWERDKATARQIWLIRNLWKNKGNKQRPVFIMGDANERREFCRKVRRKTALWAMNSTENNKCPVPPGGPDWLMGNKHGVVYPAYRLIPTLSDHDMRIARARVRPSDTWFWRR